MVGDIADRTGLAASEIAAALLALDGEYLSVVEVRPRQPLRRGRPARGAAGGQSMAIGWGHREQSVRGDEIGCG